MYGKSNLERAIKQVRELMAEGVSFRSACERASKSWGVEMGALFKAFS